MICESTDLRACQRRPYGVNAGDELRLRPQRGSIPPPIEFRTRARLRRCYQDLPKVRANPARLAQVFLNLVTNSLEALPLARAGRNEVCISTQLDERERVVEEGDNGLGLDPGVCSLAFEPFVTAKQPGAGAGLGLSICQTIVTELGGEISVASAGGEGARFRVALPADSGQAAPLEH